MSITEQSVPSVAETGSVSHPLSRLTPDEITGARTILDSAGLTTATTRFVYVGLDEPHKNEVLQFEAGDHIERRIRLMALDMATGVGTDYLVSVTEGAVLRSRVLDNATDGQVPILDIEFEIIEDILNADDRWVSAIKDRGLDPALVRAVPLSAGVFGAQDEVGVRLVRVLTFYQPGESALPWAHPIDGMVTYVDLTAKAVTKVIDTQHIPVPAETGRIDTAPHATPQSTTLRPIEITQPDGASFTVDDDVVTWENWKFRVGFDVREGLTLHQLSFRDGDRERPIIYRASISEMVVPYADPSPVRYWQNYFDTGEYMYGRYTNSLELGCDCLGEIHYFDAVIADETCTPRTMRNAICLHEEDYGILYKHTDMFNGMNETRRQRRLVISFFTTIGNYDYGFYWYLYLDGTIELEAKATGCVFTSAYPGGDYEFATEIAPGLGAPFHQHLFSARLDMTVDGTTNAVEEVSAERLPISEKNPWGNAFGRSVTRLTSELEAKRDADGSVGRVWHVVNPEVKNRLGQDVGYALHPENLPSLLAHEDSSINKRATFASKHLWVTQYDKDERYPAGDFVNQHAGGAGLPAFTAADRNLDGADVVLWHTFGLTHFPRPEDWPIMPVDYTGFTLKPVGFFDRNPALGVPPSASKHCCE
ncbi:primary-amine oxidase [Rhodococcus sp. 27YEA15]|uniref:primary-amine oxidase n=1 Tax=Rhodococcus sp. 27YEA15 TaxID=3156259 RepID=UPI003C7C1F40